MFAPNDATAHMTARNLRRSVRTLLLALLLLVALGAAQGGAVVVQIDGHAGAGSPQVVRSGATVSMLVVRTTSAPTADRGLSTDATECSTARACQLTTRLVSQ